MSSLRFSRVLGAITAALLLLAGAAWADSKFELAVATDNKDVISQHDSFAPSTARIYVVYKVTLPKASRVRAAWITEKVEGYQENQKFNESNSSVEAGTFMGAFSNGRPGNAWPAGAYRVDLYVNDGLDRSIHFKVTK